jgi:hypothetical protein
VSIKDRSRNEPWRECEGELELELDPLPRPPLSALRCRRCRARCASATCSSTRFTSDASSGVTDPAPMWSTAGPTARVVRSSLETRAAVAADPAEKGSRLFSRGTIPIP